MAQVKREEAAPMNSAVGSPTRKPASPAPSAPQAPLTRSEQTMQKAMRAAAAGNYRKALDVLNAHSEASEELRNARGVCLMRLGHYEEALSLYRMLVLMPGSIWMRPETPLHFKTNFATALLLAGLHNGALEVLHAINQEDDPTVQKLRAALREWEKQLPLLRKLDWWVSRVAPFNRPVTLDFEPGTFAAPADAFDASPPGAAPAP